MPDVSRILDRSPRAGRFGAGRICTASIAEHAALAGLHGRVASAFASLRSRGYIASALLAALLIANPSWLNGSRLQAQVNGVWSSTAPSAVWSNGLFWLGGNVARGIGATADFSQQAMTNDIVVHLDTARSIGSLDFGDQGNTYNWTVDNAGNTANVLTLANPAATPIISTVQPTITVTNGTATISTILDGSEGLVVNPSGAAGTLVLTGANTFYDGPSQSNAPNGGYGAITIDGGALSIASDAPVGTIHFATPSPLGYLPTGNAPFPVSGASFIPADIVINGGALEATATFQLNSHRGIALGSAAGGGGGTIEVTSGNILTYGADSAAGVNGIISDYNLGSSLTLTGGGTLLLTSKNTYTGATNINGVGFTLEAGVANVLSQVSGVSIVSGGTFLLNGFSQNIGSLAGAGSVTNNTSSGAVVALAIGSDNTSPTFSGAISNTNNGSTDILSLLSKTGSGNQTLSTSTGATWSTTGAGGGYDLAGPSSGAVPVVSVAGGALTLDLSHAITQTNLINPYYALTLGGGTIALNEAASSSSTSQAFNGTTIASGGSAVVVTTNGASSSTGFFLGAISRSAGGTVDFTPGSPTTGNINTTNGATSFLGGWATVAGANWAGVNNSGNIVPLTSAGGSYANDAWNSGNNTTVTQNDSISGQATNSLRFNAAGPTAGGYSVTLSGAATIASGGILITAAAGANGATIGGGGSLTSGNGSDLIVNQFDAGGALTIGAQFTGSGIGLTKSGPGTLTLANASNNYSGGTTVNAGVLSISADGDLGSAGGAVILNGGTLLASGAPGSSFALNSSRGIALGPTTGFGGGTINVPAGVTFNAQGVISNNGTSISSLTKTGPGTLILPNGANSFSGDLFLNQGITVANPLIGSQLNLGLGNVTFTGNATLQESITPGSNPEYDGGEYDNSIVISNPGATATIDQNTGRGGFNFMFFTGNVSGLGGLTIMNSSGNPDANHTLWWSYDFGTTSWSYTGPTTIYNANFKYTWSSNNGTPYESQLNPRNVLNLGGSLFPYNSTDPGGGPPIQTLATQIRLVADTSSEIFNDSNQGYAFVIQHGSQIFLNSVGSGAIVRQPGSTFAIDPSTFIYVANGALSNTNGIIGGWCTTGATLLGTAYEFSASAGGTDWASVGAGGQIVQLSSYTSDTTANSGWTAGSSTSANNTTLDGSTNNKNDVVSAGSAVNSLRLVSLTTTSGATLSQTVTLQGGVNVISSGGILVTTNCAAYISGSQALVRVGSDTSTFTIAGGSLTSGNGTDLIVNQFNALAGSSLTIASAIVNNGGSSIGLTLSGNTNPDPATTYGPVPPGGLLILTNPSNSYTGPTVISASTTLQAGAANVIPQASAIVLSQEGTLNLNGFNQSVGSLANIDAASLANLNSGGYTVLTAGEIGFGATITAGTAFGSGVNIITLTVGNDNTNTTYDGSLRDGNANNLLSLEKVGSGTLTLGNWNDNVAAGVVNVSNYSGGTTITAGVLDILYDADLGPVPATPTTNITFNGNTGTPTLQFDAAYMGTSLSTNRSIVVGAGDTGYVNTNGNPLITYAGLLTVGAGGTFGKAGAGVFELDAPPNLGANSALAVSGGTLRLKYSSAATIGGTVNAAVSTGATLELAGPTAQLSQMVNVANNGTLLVSSSAPQSIGTVTGTGNAVVNTGGNLTAYQIRQNSLSINGNAVVTLSPSGSGSVGNPQGPNNTNYSSNVTSLTIGGATNAWTGTLDIGNNGLVIQYGAGTDPFATIENMVASGYNGGLWGGTGITSSVAAASTATTHPLNIGLEDFTPNANGFGSSITFTGQTITTNAVLVRLTYMDDLVLAGDMSQNDATNDALLFAANYAIGTTWSVGDITHDGSINSNDALLFAANYFIGVNSSLDGTTGNAIAVGGAAAVPEPASILLATIGALLGIRALSQRRAA